MSIESEKNEYLFLFRGTDTGQDLAPAEVQQIMTKFMAWVDSLTQQGILLGANPLEREARMVVGRNGRVLFDGPYTESKEVVGGYFLLKLNSMDEAVELAKQHPLLEIGLTVEVRPVAALCPTMRQAKEAELSSAAT